MIVDPNAPVEALPDSRLKDPLKGLVNYGSQMWQPVFCATCGKKGGIVPPQNMNFVCYICPDCAVTRPVPAGCYAVPEEIWMAKVRAECIEQFGRLLTEQELADIAIAGSTPLATLLREGVLVHGK